MVSSVINSVIKVYDHRVSLLYLNIVVMFGLTPSCELHLVCLPMQFTLVENKF